VTVQFKILTKIYKQVYTNLTISKL